MYLCDQPPIQILTPRLRPAFSNRQYFVHVVTIFVLQKLRTSSTTLLGENSGKPVPGFRHILPHCFLFVGFCFASFCCNGYNVTMSIITQVLWVLILNHWSWEWSWWPLTHHSSHHLSQNDLLIRKRTPNMTLAIRLKNFPKSLLTKLR